MRVEMQGVPSLRRSTSIVILIDIISNPAAETAKGAPGKLMVFVVGTILRLCDWRAWRI
jgi:hypothetical protein